MIVKKKKRAKLEIFDPSDRHAAEFRARQKYSETGHPDGSPAYRWNFYTDGVTQGFLKTWLEDRETARLKYVEGWSSRRVSIPALFGSCAHYLIQTVYAEYAEKIARKKKPKLPSKRRIETLIAEYETVIKDENPFLSADEEQKLEQALGMLEVVMPLYFEYWYKKDTEVEWENLENKFKVPITFKWHPQPGLMTDCNTYITGRYDASFLAGKKHRKRWLFETKTKGQVDVETLTEPLVEDVQTQLYLLALRLTHEEAPAGVYFNVIRRPQLRQKQTESLPEFLDRIEKDVIERPEFYFYRYEVALSEKEQKYWFLHRFEPTLQGLAAWTCRHQGTQLFNPGALVSPYGRSDYYDAILRGDFSNLYIREQAYSELAD